MKKLTIPKEELFRLLDGGYAEYIVRDDDTGDAVHIDIVKGSVRFDFQSPRDEDSPILRELKLINWALRHPDTIAKEKAAKLRTEDIDVDWKQIASDLESKVKELQKMLKKASSEAEHYRRKLTDIRDALDT